MGMFSEIHAEQTARKLEEIILKAMNNTDYADSPEVYRFIKKELIEWYYDECGETWGSHKANPEILKIFPPKES